MAELDPQTVQWRELFAKRIEAELGYNRELLEEIRGLVGKQNERIRKNELDIVSLKAWVPIVGGVATVGSIVATAVVQLLLK